MGWYHTHPSFGIFLSHHDLFIHHHFFAQPLQVAYVVDPIQQTRGFFQWRGGDMAQVEGFYLTADRGDRIALARRGQRPGKPPQPSRTWRRGPLPSPRGGAHQDAHPTFRPAVRELARRPAPDRGGLRHARARSWACWAWPPVSGSTSFTAGSQEQGDALKALAGSVDQVAGGQRLAIDSLLERAGKDRAGRVRQAL